MSETSLSLLDRARGDVTDEAWRRMAAVYSALLRSWLTRFEVASTDADDLIQEVLLTVSRELPQFEHYRLPKTEWTPEEKSGSATMVFTRELGGQMVRERTKHSDGTEGTFLMLFDVNQKKYRAWWFSSMGQFNDSTGQWDEAAKAFTWKLTDANGLASTAQHRFVKDKLDWTVLVENPQKVAMFRMEGSSARVTDKPKP